jgi:hypothetical protein
MSKRVNVILPDATLAVLHRVAPRGRRSSFISAAVLHYVRTRGKQRLREQLRREALASAARDLELAQEWFPLEERACRTAERKKDRA